jgi:hypothetical protein
VKPYSGPTGTQGTKTWVITAGARQIKVYGILEFTKHGTALVWCPNCATQHLVLGIAPGYWTEIVHAT